MQFVVMIAEPSHVLAIIKTIPEKWYAQVIADIGWLLHALAKPGTSQESLPTVATRISISIGRQLRMPAGQVAPMLVNCTVSEERLVTINIPLPDGLYYQIRAEPDRGSGDLLMRIFYPSSCGAVKWFGRMASRMVYDLGMRESQVSIDGEVVSVGAWNAMCSLLVAQGAEEGGEVGILMDMARDGSI